MNISFKNEILKISGENYVKFDEPMAAHTTFRAGGPADVLVTPKDEESFIKAVTACKAAAVPYMIIGNGSNLLVGDKGIRGVVFQLYHTMDDIVFEDACQNASEKINGNAAKGMCVKVSEKALEKQDKDSVIVRAGAGVMLSKLAKAAAAAGLTGLEFASGIPGTFGGAVTMNAGAYGGEMKQCVVNVKAADENGNIKMLSAGQLEMGYRTSIIQKQRYVVLEASVCLKKGDKDAIYQRMDELTAQRKAKQPLEYPSAGSTFKRPEGYFAGKLIQEAGLKGYRVGGACVSEKHSGFVVNDKGASAAEILQVIHDVQNIVMEKFSVMLEPEVRIIGEF